MTNKEVLPLNHDTLLNSSSQNINSNFAKDSIKEVQPNSNFSISIEQQQQQKQGFSNEYEINNQQSQGFPDSEEEISLVEEISVQNQVSGLTEKKKGKNTFFNCLVSIFSSIFSESKHESIISF
jgi:hypothetical protein